MNSHSAPSIRFSIGRWGFYVFLLPFYDFLSGYLIAALVLSALVVVVMYVTAGGIGIREGLEVEERPMAHLSGLGGVFLLALAWKYRLKIYGLLYSQGRFFRGRLRGRQRFRSGRSG